MGVSTSTPVKIIPARGPADVDGNGTVEPEDARLALRAAVSLEYLTDAAYQAADSDGDGRITPADARAILRVAVKLDPLENWGVSQNAAKEESSSDENTADAKKADTAAKATANGVKVIPKFDG